MSIETPFFKAVVGNTVSHLWRGHGSALFVEFGELSPTVLSDGRDGQPRGEVSLMIEWSWRVSNQTSILAGSWSEEEEWPEVFQDLVGSTVEAIELFGELPEILVSLSNGNSIASFMTADGQPQWALISRQPNIGSLSVEAGKLTIQPHSAG